ncbi:MAG: hypothetical protein M0P57_04410 [Syntrophales bacterium]|jgi:hypothetical protein|nr:hypothetical protein [Syntrophales bacterium]MDY0045185.1 hypothetical protein [Syntrophales bacterium]
MAQVLRAEIQDWDPAHKDPPPCASEREKKRTEGTLAATGADCRIHCCRSGRTFKSGTDNVSVSIGNKKTPIHISMPGPRVAEIDPATKKWNQS